MARLQGDLNSIVAECYVQGFMSMKVLGLMEDSMLAIEMIALR